MNKKIPSIIMVCYIFLSVTLIAGIVDVVISFSKAAPKNTDEITNISTYETTSHIETTVVKESAETTTERKECNLIVKYVDRDTYTQLERLDYYTYRVGAYYSVRPVDIPGYRPEQLIMNGTITEDTTIIFYYHLIEQETTKTEETETTIPTIYRTMPNVCGQLLPNAKETLTALGFTNIVIESDKSIWIDSNWTIQTQSIDPGRTIPTETKIVLFCVKTDEYIPPESPTAIMPDVCFQLYSTAMDTLKSLGFVNVSYEANGSFIWIDSNWTVINQSIEPGKEIGKGTSIVLTCIKTTEYLDNLDVKMIDVVGLTASEAEKKLSEAGFRNITINHNPNKLRQRSISGDSKYKVVSQSVKSGTTVKAGNEVVLSCELNTVTVKNSIAFANLMAMPSQTNYTAMKSYADSHYGEMIEFDGCIFGMTKNPNYSTIFSFLILGVDYGTTAKGPVFGFKDVSYAGMYVNGSDSVLVGMNFRIIASISGYDETGIIILSPISLIAR